MTMNLKPWVSRSALAAALTMILAASSLAHEPAGKSETDTIRHVLMANFDQPQARLHVEPIVVHGETAIASWSQGERGGRALLKRKTDGKSWDIVLCAGDGLKDVALLLDAGISAADAQALTHTLADAEARLSPALRARFASFDGVVRMGPNGDHPPGHSAGGQHHEGQKHAH